MQVEYSFLSIYFLNRKL